MTTFLLATFTASLIGSLHCAGMCGPFVLMATGTAETKGRWRRLAAYHGGRLVSYATLGGLAGLAGAALDLSGQSLGVQRAAAVVAGVLLIAFGLVALLRATGRHVPYFALPKPAQRAVQAAHRQARSWPPLMRSASIGLLSVLLPCGWLFLFVLTAAGTASGITGMLVLTAFWLGTLPVLTIFAAGVAKLSSRFRTALPFATAALCLIAGSHTLLVRAQTDLSSMDVPVLTPDATTGFRVDALNDLSEKPLPCCHGH